MSLSADHNNIYGPDAIRRYLKGEMSASEMYAFEKAMHEDPFLDDAVEGMRNREPNLLSRDTAELSQRLSERVDDTSKRMPVPGKWWRYAAAAAVIGFIGFTAWYFNLQNRNKTLMSRHESAPQEKSLPLSVQADSALHKNEDTTSGVINPEEKKSGKNDLLAMVPSPGKSSDETTSGAPLQNTTNAAAADTPSVNRKDISLNDKPPALIIEKESKTPEPAALILSKTQEKKMEQSRQDPQKNTRAGHAPSGGTLVYFTGRVMDSSSRPIPFANISSTDNSSLTYTDAQGNYRFMAGDTLLNIQVKSIGYVPKKLTLNHRQPSIQIIMEKNQKAPDVMPAGNKGLSEKDSTNTDSTDIDDLPEAEPADGWGLYHMYLLNNIRMPRDAALNKISGTVVVSFMVNEQGWLYNFKVEKSLCPSCDREAIRLIREGPRWVLYNSNEPLRTTVTVIF